MIYLTDKLHIKEIGLNDGSAIKDCKISNVVRGVEKCGNEYFLIIDNHLIRRDGILYIMVSILFHGENFTKELQISKKEFWEKSFTYFEKKINKEWNKKEEIENKLLASLKYEEMGLYKDHTHVPYIYFLGEFHPIDKEGMVEIKGDKKRVPIGVVMSGDEPVTFIY